MKRVIFTVEGVAVPKGSTKSFVINGKAATTNANPKTKGWEMRVATEAQAKRGDFYVPKTSKGNDAVEVVAAFFLSPPKTGKRSHPTVKPDIDKLARTVLDALTGVMFEDDSQVTQLVARKQYLEKNDETPPFVLIEVMTDD